ncbi:MAG TPA: class I SAM-dependent methyltransferase, partial [Candidatus Omnitrophota bacterium]|nr:class I SAM-dependent methyltransferase [Candidatus Omnitrophota bacterium]
MELKNIFQERVSPLKENTAVFQSHYAAYKYASGFSKGKKVLDAGCGMGYGSAVLSENAFLCIGVDRCPEAVDFAKKTYKADNLYFLGMAVEQLGFKDGAFDLISSLQVIEHLTDPVKYLNEATRVLDKDGVFIVSTPNKERSGGSLNPLNPYHTREFSGRELESLL